jgi:diguanylate cyclase (GGDEF)-like protein
VLLPTLAVDVRLKAKLPWTLATGRKASNPWGTSMVDEAYQLWHDRADGLLSTLSSRLLSLDEFDTELTGLGRALGAPFRAISVTITSVTPPLSIELGDRDPAELKDTTNIPLGDGTVIKLETWPDVGTAAQDRRAAAELIGQILEAWWGVGRRGEKAHIASAQITSVQRSLESTLANWAIDRSVALIFADLDHFKLFNDQRGEIEGDRLIARLGMLITKHTPRTSIPIHRGGDEFLVAMPVSYPAEALVQTVALRRIVWSELLEGEQLTGPEAALGLSMGLAIAETTATYSEIETRADRALKPDGQKQRGRVSVESSAELEVSPSGDDCDLAVTRVLSMMGEPQPFGNLWLGALSLMAETAAMGEESELVAALSSALSEVDPTWAAGALEAARPSSSPLSGRRDLSRLDIALALSHGVCRSQLRRGGDEVGWRLNYISDGSAAQIERVGGTTVSFPVEAAGEDFDHEFDLPWSQLGGSDFDSHRILRVQIGPEDLDLPDEIFAQSVYVDDRPTIGGGLPDFWEAALAQTLATIVAKPNITSIVVTGRPENATETIRWLDTASTWDSEGKIDYLAYKLGLPSQHIRDAAERLSHNVTQFSDRAALLSAGLTAIGRSAELKAGPPAELANERPRALRRTLNMRSLQLRPEDGCRVETAYEAYPVALEIVRQSESMPVRDQSSREFVELVDFRIQLTRPAQDTVPRYHQQEQASLEEYFVREFRSLTGKFRAPLEAGQQLPLVIDHVAQTIAKRGFTSRRAVLVVPHAPTNADDLSPMGLIAVRIIPRWEPAGGPRLDFSFSWRTVEAIVGLPYSLYGSIRFGQELTGMVRERLAGTQPTVTMGEMSYIAHSLHMYTYEYTKNIARAIVNDETR